MLASFRGALNTWPARLLFLMLAAAFAVWGVANKNPFGSDPNALARVAGTSIELPQASQAFRDNLARLQRAMGANAEVPAQMRSAVAMQTVQQLVAQAALQARVRDLGLVVPNSALRDAAFAEPAFRDRTGKFDHATMVAVLQRNGLTETGFLDLLRHDLGQEQLLGAVRVSATTPQPLAERLFSFLHETRSADAVDFPLAAAPAPPAPTDAELHRWYANHPRSYSTPEYRRISAVVLAPETVAKDIQISDADLRDYYDKHQSEFVTEPRRSVQVLTVADQATADRLASQWSLGADWPTMQKAAQDAGATAVALDDATRVEFPAPELAEAAFTTNPDTVALPVHGALGWYVVKVTAAQPGATQSFEQAREAIRAKLLPGKASDLLDQRSVQVDDMLQGGTPLDKLPAGLGLAAVQGTLDARGNTPQGPPAPIPGPAALRTALIAAAFQAHKGDPLKLIQVPGATANDVASYYALSVDDIRPPAPRPYGDVAAQVLADWNADQRRRAQDAAAAKLMTAAQSGAGLAAAAQAAGLSVTHLPAVDRQGQGGGGGGGAAVPQALVAPLFGLRPGETTMVQTDTGFTVASLVHVASPPPSSDPIGQGQLTQALDRQIAGDMQASFVTAVTTAAQPHVNQALVDRLAQPAD